MALSENFNDSTNLIGFIYKNSKPILITTILAAIVSAVVSLFITDKYKSTEILYPSNTSSISKALINSSNGMKGDLLEFGEEEKTEQLLQVLSSDVIRNEVIKKYNLMQHYKIDTSSETKYSQLIDKFESNIKFRRNEYMAVEIIVLDENPDSAAKFANGIAEILDTRMNTIQKERAYKGFEIMERTYNNYLSYVKGLEDSLRFIMSLGVHDFEKQSEVLTQAYAEAVSKNNKGAIDAINEKLAVISKYGAQQYNLKEKLKIAAEEFGLLQGKYEEAKMDANENITNFFVVNHATPAEKKSYPIRSMIVVVTAVCTFVFSLLFLLVYEKIKQLKNLTK
jgi:uncharacterized protein involved in exopolysaccharide biosynthesis